MHRIHRTPCREEPPTDDTDVGGYGIPAIPTLPNSVNSVNSVGEKIFPQNARNTRKLLAEKSLPQMAQMRTDVGGYGIPAIPTLPNSVNSVNSVGEKIFPQNARNAQKLLAEKSLPQMSTELTEPSGREEPPTDEHVCSQIRRVWHPCHTHAAKFCILLGNSAL